MNSWQDVEGLRHAISRTDYPLPPRPDETVVVLCGKELTLAREDFPQFPEYRSGKRTCWDCDAVWRAALLR